MSQRTNLYQKENLVSYGLYLLQLKPNFVLSSKVVQNLQGVNRILNYRNQYRIPVSRRSGF